MLNIKPTFVNYLISYPFNTLSLSSLPTFTHKSIVSILVDIQIRERFKTEPTRNLARHFESNA